MTAILDEAEELCKRASIYSGNFRLEMNCGRALLDPNIYDLLAKIANSLPAVLAEARMLEDRVTQLKMDCDQQHKHAEEYKADCDRWKKIAEEKQAQIMMVAAMQPAKNLSSWNDMPEEDFPDKFGVVEYICHGKRHWREQAARELGAEASEWIRLTPERRKAIKSILKWLEDEWDEGREYPTISDEEKILRSMLAEAGE